MQCRMLSSIPGFYLQEVSSTPTPALMVATKNVSRLTNVRGGGQNYSFPLSAAALRVSAPELASLGRSTKSPPSQDWPFFLFGLLWPLTVGKLLQIQSDLTMAKQFLEYTNI